MRIKLIGATLVIFSSSMIGFIVARSFHYRPKVLRSLQGALSMFETEITYGHTPLVEALDNVSKKADITVAKLFSSAKLLMTSKQGWTPDEAWEKALQEYYSDSYLSKEDLEAVKGFGKYLGFTDCNDQIKHIRITLDNLDHLEAKALEEQNKNERLWRYIGVLSGIMVVLLLY